MNPGKVTILLALFSIVISSIAYYQSSKILTAEKREKKRNAEKINKKITMARGWYYVTTILVSLASFYLLYLILTHQYIYEYIYQYSSNDLSFGLLLSSFWAGQEGSFMLWVFITALIGLVLIKKSKAFEIYGMLFLNIVIVFFLLILTKASPFAMQEQMPVDGAGLNPLLQNFWMIIHPPILFVGYAAIAIPMSLALAALVTKKYNDWLQQALPWTIFSALMLGAGIIIGAYWSYETLGWGGYWGWDPVENSSLIPWVTVLVLLHGIIIQRRNGALMRTNFFLAIISYILVLYATFLTRSGVLADFSVHSFTNLGVNNYLLAFMLFFLIVGLKLLLQNSRSMAHITVEFSNLNRENGLVFSMIVLLIFATATFLGTSWPIISGLIGQPSSPGSDFYNMMNFPVAILIALFLGIVPALLWKETDNKAVFKRLLLALLLALIAVPPAYLAGLRKLVHLLFVYNAAFAIFSSILLIVEKVKGGWRQTGGPVAHFGIGILLIGIIVSGNLAQDKQVILQKDVPLEVLGSQLLYKGMTENSVAQIEVTNNQTVYTAKPRLYYSDYNRGYMREPDIRPGILSDLYISPLERRSAEDNRISMLKGQTKIYAGYEITFDAFQMDNHTDGGHFIVAARLSFKGKDSTFIVTPAIIMAPRGRQMQPAQLPGSGQEDPPVVALTGLNADDKQIELTFSGLGKASEQHMHEQMVVEVSIKPMMSILWLGTLLMICGTLIAFYRRLRAIA
jgi:cytochrome c-type biogenesis protein CcmF